VLAPGPVRLIPMTTTLRIGGLEKFSTVDWPGRLVATVFCQGCGWRCRYCHNPHLLSFRVGAPLEGEWTWPALVAWLRDRRGLLEGVVFSGGEPTLQAGLTAAMREARDLGFRVGLHTGGPVPALLAAALPLVDWVGFDLKAPFEHYFRITGRPGGEAARSSLQLLRESGVEHEVRTTWHPDLLGEQDLMDMAGELEQAGSRRWVLQVFRPDGCADEGLRARSPGDLPEVLLAREGLEVVWR
jgi:pyruvate formate lyase activating enzyme